MNISYDPAISRRRMLGWTAPCWRGVRDAGGWLAAKNRWVAVYFCLLAAGSMVMFMVDGRATAIGGLIDKQNEAALKLWNNVAFFARHQESELPPGLFEDVVAFSRDNVMIIRNVGRLRVLSRTLRVEQVMARYLSPKDGSGGRFDHTGVNPDTDGEHIKAEAWYQIRLYQAIRDYAQDQANWCKGIIRALTAYMLPVLWAWLGASLWKVSWDRARRGRADDGGPDVAWGSHFLIAGIAGVTVSGLNTILPEEVVGAPLAVAFVFGYSVDMFLSKLDLYASKLGPKKAD